MSDEYSIHGRFLAGKAGEEWYRAKLELLRDEGTVEGLPVVPRERYATQAELAELMGVSVKTVQRLTAAGMPSVTWGVRTRRYLPSTALAWAQAYRKNVGSLPKEAA